MVDYLPKVHRRFTEQYPEVMRAYEALADELHDAGPLSQRERRLVKLGIAAGALSEGGVRSHARKGLGEEIEPDSLRHVAALAVTTAGYPAAIAAYGWINEVIDAES